MSISVCITARHRPELLRECLEHIEKSTLQPAEVVISDDSTREDMLARNKRVLEAYPRVIYREGPRRGVCANRNHALACLKSFEYVAFLDDDALVSPEYFARAQSKYDAMPASARARVILSGVCIDREGGERSGPVKLNFRGYFVSAERTEVAGATCAIYPKAFFDAHKWDELIFFGYEDAELSLRALKDGFEIRHCEDLEMVHAGNGKSSLTSEGERPMRRAITCEAARLYVGVKRFRVIEQDYLKLAAFLPLYFGHITYSLAKRRALGSLGELIKLSNVTALI